ncbi:autotransporter-associated beta strand protein, partial [Herbaspirillum sp. Sphag1AN]
FDVDVVLGDQAQGTTSGWDGKTLTKQGAGTLILSAQNTYDGATNIEAGTLQTGIEDAFASSSAVTVDTGATLDLNNYAQTANNLSGGGNVLLGGATLTANNESEASTFAGVISGSGGLTKTGSNTLILSGDNTYSGTTTISAGTLQIGSGGADGAMGVNSGDTISIASGAALTVNRSGVLNVAATISGAGTLNQNGSGILTLSGAGSTVGTVNVNAGTLNLAQTGALNVTGNYSTATGATTVLAAGATLNVGGSFTQAANSTLALSISSAGPEIIASSANLGGELNVTLDDIGRLGNPPGTASSLISSQHTLIQTSSGISGDFTGVNLTAPDSPVDYLIIAGGKSGNNYNVGFQLSWMAAASQSNGVFTLPNVGDSFNVDVILNDESANSVGSWDGKTLTKAGLGTLILSAQNTYDGATNIEAGTLQTGIEDAFASSSAVTVDTGATLDLHNYAQTANNLSGGGNVLLGGATLTANNESEASTFAGVISGSGGLTKTGSNTLIL